MSWFDGNPLGKALAWVCGGLVALSLVMTWVWNRPVDSGRDADGEVPLATGDAALQGLELGPLSDYQVINTRPVFNESRMPEASLDGPVITDVGPLNGPTDPPEVRLTGVVITPEQRLVTLSPTGEGKPLVAREGMVLDGEYVGWTVSEVQPRGVRLESSEGETLDLPLVVHSETIAEPPRPEPSRPEPSADEEVSGEEAETLSRAEEIRRRIQERREQLRQEADQERQAGDEEQSEQRSQYQQAIMNMVSRNRKNNDDETEGEADDEE